MNWDFGFGIWGPRRLQRTKVMIVSQGLRAKAKGLRKKPDTARGLIFEERPDCWLDHL